MELPSKNTKDLLQKGARLALKFAPPSFGLIYGLFGPKAGFDIQRSVLQDAESTRSSLSLIFDQALAADPNCEIRLKFPNAPQRTIEVTVQSADNSWKETKGIAGPGSYFDISNHPSNFTDQNTDKNYLRFFMYNNEDKTLKSYSTQCDSQWNVQVSEKPGTPAAPANVVAKSEYDKALSDKNDALAAEKQTEDENSSLQARLNEALSKLPSPGSVVSAAEYDKLVKENNDLNLRIRQLTLKSDWADDPDTLKKIILIEAIIVVSLAIILARRRPAGGAANNQQIQTLTAERNQARNERDQRPNITQQQWTDAQNNLNPNNPNGTVGQLQVQVANRPTQQAFQQEQQARQQAEQQVQALQLQLNNLPNPNQLQQLQQAFQQEQQARTQAENQLQQTETRLNNAANRIIQNAQMNLAIQAMQNNGQVSLNDAIIAVNQAIQQWQQNP